MRCFAVLLGSDSPHTHAISCSVPIARLDEPFEAFVVDTLFQRAAEFADPAGIRLLTQ